MKFNLWFVLLLALMPMFILFVGLTAAGGFESSASWEVTGVVAFLALAASYLAMKRAEDNATTTSNETFPTDDALTSAAERETGNAAGYSSPPCYLHEVSPAYLGYSSREEVRALLNELLEAERAGARGIREMSEQAADAQALTSLREIPSDEARFCAMLCGHIARLGETPSSQRGGGFHEHLGALEALDDQLALLDRDQGWFVRKLREAIPRIADDPLRADLEGMLAAHQRNIERCSQLVEGQGPAPGAAPHGERP